MAAHYSFPMLGTGEIMECMSELGCPLSEEQLTKPAPEHIARVMEQLLDLFMGFSADDHTQIKFSGMDAFDHPELHEFSVGQLAFNRSMFATHPSPSSLLQTSLPLLFGSGGLPTAASANVCVRLPGLTWVWPTACAS